MKREGTGSPPLVASRVSSTNPRLWPRFNPPIWRVAKKHQESEFRSVSKSRPHLGLSIPVPSVSKLGGAKRMRLLFKHSDDFRSNCLLVLDEDTGKEVGTIRLGGAGADSSGGIDIWLFDGK